MTETLTNPFHQEPNKLPFQPFRSPKSQFTNTLRFSLGFSDDLISRTYQQLPSWGVFSFAYSPSSWALEKPGVFSNVLFSSFPAFKGVNLFSFKLADAHLFFLFSLYICLLAPWPTMLQRVNSFSSHYHTRPRLSVSFFAHNGLV